MKKTNRLIIAFFILALPFTGMAGDATSSGKKISKLVNPAVQGTQCVSDRMDMRLNHMNYIYHQRKETTRLGKRWPKKQLKKNYSFELCINCHARKKQDGKILPVSIKDKSHFCASCHRKVSVNIDCFDCHNSKPTGKANITTSATVTEK